MSKQLKNIYTKEFLLNFSKCVQSAYPAFPINEFILTTMDEAWEELPLKARMRRIAERLGDFLPSQYEDALDILFTITDDCDGFPYLFFPDFVAVFGQAEKHWDLSMKALETFTQKSSSEFAIRPFLLSHPERVMSLMTQWAQHPNEHVRRFASEGCRPRLPWGEALPLFKKDPSLILPILELLKEDPSLYVRKSVANNLNDIAKDNPDIVIDIAKRWIGKNPHTDWIVRHGCRTLIKKANPEIMSLFGYADDKQLTTAASITIHPSEIQIGENSELQYKVNIQPEEPVHIRIEYAIDFVKANGKPSRKSFLLSDKTVAGGSQLMAKRTHKWVDLTTRRHYPGDHRIVLLVNGREVADTMLKLNS